MMTNLFSIFDPSTSTILSLNWISLSIPLTIMHMNYWLILSRINMMWMLINKSMFTEFKLLTKKTYLLISLSSLD